MLKVVRDDMTRNKKNCDNDVRGSIYWKILIPLSIMAWTWATVSAGIVVMARLEQTRRTEEGYQLVQAPLDKLALNGLCAEGKPGAPFKIQVFIDYDCPYCREISPEIDRILVRYPSQVSATFRNFPLERIHNNAWRASVASVVAARHGVFQKVRAKFLTSTNSPKSVEANLRAVLPNVRISYSEIHEAAKYVMGDVVLGNTIHVEGTPSLYLVDPVGAVRKFDSASKMSEYLGRAIPSQARRAGPSPTCINGCLAAS